MFSIVENQKCMPGLFDELVVNEIFWKLDGFPLWPLRCVSRAWQNAIVPSMVTTLEAGIVRTSAATDAIVEMTNLETLSIMYAETSTSLSSNSGGPIFELATWNTIGIVPDTLKHFPKLRALNIHIDDLIEDYVVQDYANVLKASCPELQYVTIHLDRVLHGMSAQFSATLRCALPSVTSVVLVV